MAEKPPVGLIPKYLRQAERAREIVAAINRYLEAGKYDIPNEWAKELDELLTHLRIHVRTSQGQSEPVARYNEALSQLK